MAGCHPSPDRLIAAACGRLGQWAADTEEGVQHLQSIAAGLYGQELFGDVNALQPHILSVWDQDLPRAMLILPC